MITHTTSHMTAAAGMSRPAFTRRLAELGLALAFMPAIGRRARRGAGDLLHLVATQPPEVDQAIAEQYES